MGSVESTQGRRIISFQYAYPSKDWKPLIHMKRGGNYRNRKELPHGLLNDEYAHWSTVAPGHCLAKIISRRGDIIAPNRASLPNAGGSQRRFEAAGFRFRAASTAARVARRGGLAQSPHRITRSLTAPPPPSPRSFHSSPLKAAAPVPRPVPLSRLTDSFLNGTSSVYLEELQRAREADPNSVDESWDNFFRNFVGQATTSIGISGQTIQESMRLSGQWPHEGQPRSIRD
ncbi:hypothetical protein KSP40_PGU014039 [Platanthera guangdongensis]|uniref:2-oxoglutarate dehydrogenase E1 component N-terminal domain-containing protein n=1 Tax=Platanthera guangdongensis TaxID=2320717 RepID=A0ABR2MCQ9_9ASPA